MIKRPQIERVIVTKVFFSWQADTSTREGRNFLEDALRRALKRISQDVELDEAIRDSLEVDRDTKGVAGQPSIVDTIFKKIDQAAVFVPDLTFVGTRIDGRPAPNPNVLIEYGWALKSVTNDCIVAVMNTAHGQPGDDMPFDMRHLRHPIQYCLSDGADTPTRRSELERLVPILADAIGAVLKSDVFAARFPTTSRSPSLEFPAAETKGNPARFSLPSEPVGLLSWPQAGREVYLKEGACIWLRVMPLVAPPKELGLVEAEGLLSDRPPISTLRRRVYGGLTARAADGVSVCGTLGDDGRTPEVAKLFVTGEIWFVDASLVEEARQYKPLRPGIPTLEGNFKSALRDAALLLDRLGHKRPFRWIGGYEGIKGMGLYYSPPPNRVFLESGPFGAAAADCVEATGLMKDGDTPAMALKPLFTKLFDVCGRSRQDYHDDLENPPAPPT